MEAIRLLGGIILLSIQLLHFVNCDIGDACTSSPECVNDVADSECTILNECACKHGYEAGGTTACNYKCQADELYCSNGNCVNNDLQNNGINDCGDNSDEGVYRICEPIFNAALGITLGAFKCTDGSACILDFQIADGAANCFLDESDEHKWIGAKCNYFLYSHGQDPFTCGALMDDSECDPTDVCICRSGAYPQDDSLGCIVRKLGDTCGTDLDCHDAVANSVCDPLCTCDDGYMQISLEECRLRKIYDPCDVDLDCSAAVTNSYCGLLGANNVCLCNSGYKITTEDSMCELRIIGDACVSDTDCSDAVTNSECSSSSCACTYNYLASGDLMSCNYRELGDTCTASDHCLVGITNSVCDGDGLCSCNQGYRQENPTTCTLRVLNDACGDNTDCSAAVTNSECNGGFCKCELAYYDADESTCTIREIGTGPCENDEGCEAAVSNSVCATSLVCECLKGYQEVGTTQCTANLIGDDCTEDADCSSVIDDSYCIDAFSVCSCVQNYSPTDDLMTCVKNDVTDLTCTTNSDCTVLVAHTECVEGKCACQYGYAPAADGQSCMLFGSTTTTTKKPFIVGNETCNSDGDCTSEAINSFCDEEGICQCKDGYFVKLDKSDCTLPLIGILECSSDAVCATLISNTECTNGRCVCRSSHKADSSRLFCNQTELNNPCTSNETCSAIANSYCYESVCTCDVGYDSVNGTCVAPPVSTAETSTTDAPECTDFLCKYWWIIIVIILVVILIIVIILIIYCKLKGKACFRRKKKPRRDKENGVGGLIRSIAPSLWSRPNVAVMYKTRETREPKEIYMGPEKKVDLKSLLKPEFADPKLEDRFPFTDNGSSTPEPNINEMFTKEARQNYRFKAEKIFKRVASSNSPYVAVMYKDSVESFTSDIGELHIFDPRFATADSGRQVVWSVKITPNVPVMYEHKELLEPTLDRKRKDSKIVDPLESSLPPKKHGQLPAIKKGPKKKKSKKLDTDAPPPPLPAESTSIPLRKASTKRDLFKRPLIESLSINSRPSTAAEPRDGVGNGRPGTAASSVVSIMHHRRKSARKSARVKANATQSGDGDSETYERIQLVQNSKIGNIDEDMVQVN